MRVAAKKASCGRLRMNGLAATADVRLLAWWWPKKTLV